MIFAGSANPALVDAMLRVVRDQRRKLDIRRQAAVALGKIGVNEHRVVEAISSLLQEPDTDSNRRDIANAMLELDVSNDLVRDSLVGFLSSVKGKSTNSSKPP